ncbi:MAG: tetratricopeptide repeat protein, partial [Anaerohalosphaera sp.]|nr:tetratricopeptide repeat protein [Anaerohalosphaera sp.]
MSKLLEILGKAINVNTFDLLWHWLTSVAPSEDVDRHQADEFAEILESISRLDINNAYEKLKFYRYENPDCVVGQMAEVDILLHLNDVETAIEMLEKIRHKQPSNTMALYVLGYCYERTQQQDKAIQCYQDCLKFKNHLQLPHQRMAAIYFSKGRLDRAIERYQQLITEHPDDISSMVLLGYLNAADQKWDKAVDMFNMAILSHPDNFHEDNQTEDNQLIENGQTEIAIEKVQWLIEQTGEMPDLLVRLADIYSKSGHTAEAVTYYQLAIQKQPSYLEATIKLGTHFLRMNQRAMAAEQFNRAIEINDEIVDAYIGLSMAQHNMGAKDEALSTLSLASAILQNSTLLFTEVATIKLQITIEEMHENENIEALPTVLMEDVVKAYANQAQLNPGSADTHYRLAMLMMSTNNMDSAVECLKTTIELNPTHHRAITKIAICLHETAKSDQAVNYLN